MIRWTCAGVLTLAFCTTSPAWAQPHAHAPESRRAAAQAGPTQGGQAAFAAVREIVQLLEADPRTDWSKVDITSLRQHLVDMDNVMLRTQLWTVPIPGGARFEVSAATPDVVASTQRMAVAHAAAPDVFGPGRRAEAQATPTGAVVSVVGSSPDDAARIRALGFYGLLAEGDHHGPHHLALARGLAPHAH